MEVSTKYNTDELVFFILGGRVIRGVIKEIRIVISNTIKRIYYKFQFGEIEIEEKFCFTSKEELVASL